MTVLSPFAIIILLGAMPAVAQDMPGAVDLGQLSRTQTQSAIMRGHAERDAARMTRGPNGVPLSAKARAYCDGFPSLRRQYGRDDPRVERLAAACRRAGYAY